VNCGGSLPSGKHERRPRDSSRPISLTARPAHHRLRRHVAAVDGHDCVPVRTGVLDLLVSARYGLSIACRYTVACISQHARVLKQDNISTRLAIDCSSTKPAVTCPVEEAALPRSHPWGGVPVAVDSNGRGLSRVVVTWDSVPFSRRILIYHPTIWVEFDALKRIRVFRSNVNAVADFDPAPTGLVRRPYM